ncbi:MAG: hypothetical protein COT73_02090 [Bdellovibrio sp. CG10_big_fil_rev_8_21_14_0_10_47_8]|nr:MAG: hypothetical protein COT73_02090 [Bdellovibrio sp. CG10_big_fil_rev_8_21_14_0_10_47_8]
MAIESRTAIVHYASDGKGFLDLPEAEEHEAELSRGIGALSERDKLRVYREVCLDYDYDMAEDIDLIREEACQRALGDSFEPPKRYLSLDGDGGFETEEDLIEAVAGKGRKGLQELSQYDIEEILESFVDLDGPGDSWMDPLEWEVQVSFDVRRKQ